MLVSPYCQISDVASPNLRSISYSEGALVLEHAATKTPSAFSRCKT
jgi:hypothetical protein